MKKIDELIKKAAEHYGLNYSAEVDSAENVTADQLEGDTLWQSIVDDGTIEATKYGQLAITRHIRLMFLRPVGLDDNREVWQGAKNDLLDIAANVTASILASCETAGYGVGSQSGQFESGYDKFDANLAYVLVNIYIKTINRSCPVIVKAHG